MVVECQDGRGILSSSSSATMTQRLRGHSAALSLPADVVDVKV
jgi:hypothetical protein